MSLHGIMRTPRKKVMRDPPRKDMRWGARLMKTLAGATTYTAKRGKKAHTIPYWEWLQKVAEAGKNSKFRNNLRLQPSLW